MKAIIIALLLAAAPVMAQERFAAKEDSTSPAPPLASEEALKLRLEVQQLKKALHAATVDAAQCDAGFADARARLASLTLTANKTALTEADKSLEAEVQRSGFTLVDVPGPDGKPTGRKQLEKKKSEPPK